ncbi:MAG: methylmalonyl-CoA epimerase, partial [Rhodobiaceae bacterium]|nr:methylmalonyl-CoA epimerase [Rhodobiaceae bacterium]
MIRRLNHVGVATPSIDEAVKLYRDVLGATKIGEKFKMEEQGVWVCFVDLPNSQIELIEPIDGSSTITGFLKN